MDGYKTKNKSSIIIFIILIIIISLLSIISVLNIISYHNLKSNKEKKENELFNLDKEIKYITIQNTELTNQLNDLKNIDENIKLLKEDVFNSAKELENKIINNQSNYKIAYITFDDGPYYLTYTVLDVLKQNKIKATFFTIGQSKEACFDNKKEDCTKLYSKIVENGHTIANHTYSHAISYGLYNSSDSFIKQIKKQEENIKNRTGVTTNITRFPGGSSTAKNLKNSIIEKLRDLGYGWVDWSAADGDGGTLDSKETAWKNFTNSINENIEVVLFHDYSKITLSILPDAIKYLQDNNYILLPLFYESVKVNK